MIYVVFICTCFILSLSLSLLIQHSSMYSLDSSLLTHTFRHNFVFFFLFDKTGVVFSYIILVVAFCFMTTKLQNLYTTLYSYIVLFLILFLYIYIFQQTVVVVVVTVVVLCCLLSFWHTI